MKDYRPSFKGSNRRKKEVLHDCFTIDGTYRGTVFKRKKHPVTLKPYFD